MGVLQTENGERFMRRYLATLRSMEVAARGRNSDLEGMCHAILEGMRSAAFTLVGATSDEIDEALQRFRFQDATGYSLEMAKGQIALEYGECAREQIDLLESGGVVFLKSSGYFQMSPYHEGKVAFFPPMSVGMGESDAL